MSWCIAAGSDTGLFSPPPPTFDDLGVDEPEVRGSPEWIKAHAFTQLDNTKYNEITMKYNEITNTMRD